jgi:hypothetical protein
VPGAGGDFDAVHRSVPGNLGSLDDRALLVESENSGRPFQGGEELPSPGLRVPVRTEIAFSPGGDTEALYAVVEFRVKVAVSALPGGEDGTAGHFLQQAFVDDLHIGKGTYSRSRTFFREVY